jgi:hypothetical protein
LILSLEEDNQSKKFLSPSSHLTALFLLSLCMTSIFANSHCHDEMRIKKKFLQNVMTSLHFSMRKVQQGSHYYSSDGPPEGNWWQLPQLKKLLAVYTYI